MNQWKLHTLDCAMAFAVAFFSALLAVEEVNIKVIAISFMSAATIGIIKFREYLNTLLVAKKDQKKKTIFF